MGINSRYWLAVIIVLLSVWLLVKGVSNYTRGRYRRDIQTWGPSKETNDREGSCSQSEIQHNVTLKGGILAGYFRKLAQYVAMQLCVELCCEEKGCDVAFMSGRNCYGVQCFSEDQCQSIPAKKVPPEPIFISHVTFKGEGAQKTHEPKNLQCSATRMKVGVTLRGGLKSGNFTDVGKVDSMVICAKLCCVAEKCDLAMMINQSCFLVSCYTMELCQVIKAISNKYQPSVAYVMRRTGELQSETATKLQSLHTTDSKLMCKNSQIFYNSTLRGGYKAGNFTDLGRVTNMTACVRLCCGDKNCDAAFMLEKNCYAVACIKEDLCTPVHAKKSGALISLNPKISFITSRSEEVMSKKIVSEDGSCHAGVISYDVTLRGGMSAGNFTAHGKVGNMEACIEKCCRLNACNAAMMLKDACFTVACFKDELCEKKPIPTSSSYNPKIAYVFREKRPKKKALTTKRPLATLLQRLKLISYQPSVKHSTQKHHFKTTNNSTFSNHNKTHRSNKTHSYNSTERLTQLLNETSYTEEEIKHVTPNRFVNLPTIPVSFENKRTSLHEMVNSIMPDTTIKQSEISYPTTSNYYDSKSLNSSMPETKIATSKPGISMIGGSKSREFEERSEYENRTLVPTNHPSNQIESNESKTIETKESVNQEKSEEEVTPTTDPLLSFVMEEPERSKPEFPKPTADLIVSVRPDSSKHSSDVLSVMPGLSLIGEDAGCTNSEIIKNVTLRGGITAGRFKDRGKMDDFRQCLKICCLAKACDLAFMLSNNCFSVECINEELCEAVPARAASIDPPILAYIYARSSPVARRDVDMSRDQSVENALFHLVKRTVNIAKESSSVVVLKKRSVPEDWADERTIPRLRLKIPNR